MGWSWRFERSDGGEVDPRPASAGVEDFPSQADAESWIGEIWRTLLDEGVDQVTLLEGDREVYAGMSLHPPR